MKSDLKIGDLVSFGHSRRHSATSRLGIVVEFIENDVRLLVTSEQGTFYKVRRVRVAVAKKNTL